MNFEFKDIKAPWSLSQSQINSYETCKLKYMFRYFTNIGDIETTWPGTLFGKVQHAILEDLLNSINAGERDEMTLVRSVKGQFEDRYNDMRKAAGKKFKLSRDYNEEDYLSDGDKYSRILASFINKFIPLNFHKLLSEFKIYVPYNERLRMTGITDVTLFTDENHYEIFDLKVTIDSSKYYFVDWDYEIQSILYEHLTNHQFGFPMELFTFIVLNRHERALFLKQQYKILDDEDRKKQKFEDLFKEVAEIDEFIFNLPKDNLKALKCNKYDQCKWCNYKKEYCDKI